MKPVYFFNPFMKFQERALLITGILSLLLASWAAAALNIIYDGVINIHLTAEQNFIAALLQNIIAVMVLFVCLYGISLFVNQRTRVIDILNVALIFRIPLYLMAFVIPATKSILQKLPDIQKIEQFKPSGPDLILLTVIGFVCLIMLAYAVILLINGFKTATNSKKWFHVLFIVTGLLMADLIAKMMITRFFLQNS
ncbi:hypothetical protein [Niabella aquatica]